MGGDSAGYQAVARLYHGWITGLIVMVASQRGAAPAAELMFRLFRRQHRATFLAGIEKLGLAGLPAAVASAQYHYLSNQIGGVRVEYIYESDRKAWIRYPPPRWIWQGPAICAIPSEVSRAILRGWHAENGVSLGNPRLGFVCTKQTVDGQDALEGYFLEHDRALEPEERLRFAPGEEAPPFDPAAAPRLAAEWTPERLDKARRNYAMEYVRSLLPELVELSGPEDAGQLASRSAYLMGMQLSDELKAMLGVAGAGVRGFAEFFLRLAVAQDDRASAAPVGDGVVIRQKGWRLMQGVALDEDLALAAWDALWQGLLAAHDRWLAWRSLAREPGVLAWQIASRARDYANGLPSRA
jgi:hypothetical protein